MKKFTTILFDADDTLLDFHKDERQALEKALTHYGVPVTEENIKIYSDINQGMWKQLEKGEITKPELKRTRFKKFFEAIDFVCEEDPLTVNEYYLSLLGEGGNTLEGAVETVKALHEEGYELYIITNGIADSIILFSACFSKLLTEFKHTLYLGTVVLSGQHFRYCVFA